MSSNIRKLGRPTALIAAGLVVGGVLAGAMSANAADTTTAPSPTSSSLSVAPSNEKPTNPNPGDQSKPQRSDETLLTGDAASKVISAVKAKYPDATIVRAETDSDGVYEAHITKADGTPAIVQLDANYAITGEDARGGGSGGGHRGGGAPNGAADHAGQSTATPAA